MRRPNFGRSCVASSKLCLLFEMLTNETTRIAIATDHGLHLTASVHQFTQDSGSAVLYVGIMLACWCRTCQQLSLCSGCDQLIALQS